MGGRGASSGIGRSKIPTNSTQKNIVEFIKTQTNVDVNKYRDDFTAKFEVKDGVLLYWKDVPKTEKQTIQDLRRRYNGKLNLEDVGAWGKLIRFKR